MRALIYTRVSTDEQAKTGFSLANQEKECKYFAEKNGYEVVKVYVEKGESGSTSKRTEFQKLIKYCLTHSKEIDALIVYKLDRFMRNLEEQITIINQFKKIGIRVLAVHDPNDDKTASGILMRNILGCFNQYENDLKSERVTAGMKEAFLQGNWQWRAPLGYKTVNKNIAPDPKTAPIVKKIFELFKTGLYTQVQIISIIEKDGLTINANHMSRLLQNPIYCGIMVKKEWSANPIKGNFEPLITEKTFYKVQNILSGRKPHIAPHLRNNPLFPLRQFITCPHCNQPLTGSSSTGRRKIKYNYYHCYNRDCGVNFRIPKDRLEEEISRMFAGAGVRGEDDDNDDASVFPKFSSLFKRRGGQKKKAEADGNGIDPLTLALERSFGKLAEDAPNTNSRLEKIFNAETPAEENGENGVADKYSFTGTNESLIKLQRELEELTTEKTGDAAATETGRETTADNNAQKEEADAPKADA